MRQKNFLAKRKHHRARKRAKARVRAFEAREVNFEELPELAKTFLARKRRAAAQAPAQ